MKKLKLNNKVMFISFNVIGIIIFALGGAKLLAIITALVMGFLLGKYLEKALQTTRDYRLMQKVNKLNYTQTEINHIKEENENLKQIIINTNRTVRQKPNIPSDSFLHYENLERYENTPFENY